MFKSYLWGAPRLLLWNIFYDGVFKVRVSQGTKLIGFADETMEELQVTTKDEIGSEKC